MRESRRDAIERAYEHWPAAHALAVVLLGDHARAEELCQDAFVRLMTTARELDTDRPMRGLVLTTTRNLCRNELRRTRPGSLDELRNAGAPDPRTPGSLADPDPGPLAGSGPDDPVTRLDLAERGSAVRAALARLSPTWRELVFLRDGLGLSYRELAAVAATSEDVVRTTLTRARARLRELLAEHAPEGGRP